MSSDRSKYGFTEGEEEPTRRAVLDRTRTLLEEASVSSPDRSAEWLLTEVLGCSRVQLYAYPERSVDREHRRRLSRLLERRLHGEPLQYVLGYTEFYGLRIAVDRSVLIPRPETERVVERALEELEGRSRPRVLDVGTGSGCIALALADRRPDALIVASDCSEEALEVARRNVRELDLDVRVRRADLRGSDYFVPGDVDGPGSTDGGAPSETPFDLLVSNPPYVPEEERAELAPEVREHEPAEALFTPGDPLFFYRRLARHGHRLLGEDGALVLEVHAGYGEEVLALLEEAGYVDLRLRDDWTGRARVVRARKTSPAAP